MATAPDGTLWLLDGRGRFGVLGSEKGVQWSPIPKGLRDADAQYAVVSGGLISVDPSGLLRRLDQANRIVAERALKMEVGERVTSLEVGDGFVFVATSRGRVGRLAENFDGTMAFCGVAGPPRALLPGFGQEGAVLAQDGQLIRFREGRLRIEKKLPRLRSAAAEGPQAFGLTPDGRLISFRDGSRGQEILKIASAPASKLFIQTVLRSVVVPSPSCPR